MKNFIRVFIFLFFLVMMQVLLSIYLDFTIVKYFSVFLTMSIIFFSIVIFLENRNPTQTVAWLAVFSSVPFLGFVFYLMFGRNYRKQRMFRKKHIADMKTAQSIAERKLATVEFMKTFSHEKANVMKLSRRLGNPISFASDTEVLTNGEITFQEIKAAIEKAEHHIHLEYYIVRHDTLGQKLKELLIRKAKEGVEVRFLFDDVGSGALSSAYIKELSNNGVQTMSFNPVRMPILNSKVNFRNHRKIVVVDGEYGFVGGLNIGDEYLGKDEYFGFWRDTHLKITGEAVRRLQIIFLQDWLYMSNEKIELENYLPVCSTASDPQHGGVQIIASGPDKRTTVIKDIFFSMITSAQKSVWIASPYFIPDEDILTGLKIAALSGVDVRLLVPGIADHKIPFHASRSYFPVLLEAGVKIYEYAEGFMHSKIIIVDGELASIGTANMDMRSFHLNFEVNAFLYQTKSILKLQEDYMQDVENSNQIDHEEFHNRAYRKRIFESLARIISPLL